MKRSAILLLGVGSPAMLVAMLVGGVWAERCFVAGALLFPVALCALGAGRSARPFLAALGIVLLITGWMLVAPAGPVSGTSAPSGTAGRALWMIVGFTLLPLLITGLGYAVDHRASRPEEPPGKARGRTARPGVR